jgi:short-subunit dehydrogenase
VKYTLRGKTVLITGASSGIGRELALALGREDCRLILVARREALLRELQADLEKTGVKAAVKAADLSLPKDIAELEAYVRGRGQGLDVLVNNAGILRKGTVARGGLGIFRENMETNFFACLDLTQKMLPLLRASGQGLVVNVSSGLGRRSLPSLAAYCASKFALEALSESLRVEEARNNIQVLVVRPDLTKTDMNSGAGVVQSAGTVARLTIKAMKKRRAELNCTWRVSLLNIFAAPLGRVMDGVLKWVHRSRPAD